MNEKKNTIGIPNIFSNERTGVNSYISISTKTYELLSCDKN